MSSASRPTVDGIEPLVSNPGGVVDPVDLIGREVETERLVRSVVFGGARVLGDRRFGKTSLLRKVEQELAAVGHTVIRVSAQTKNPSVFATRLADAMRSHRRFREAWRRWEKEFAGELHVEVGVFGFRLSGKTSSTGSAPETDLLRRAAEEAGRGQPYRTIFILDEITVLAEGLSRTGPGAAAEFMGTLRTARQEIAGVSMIIAGSVGLHHVLPDLNAVNDLDPVTVGPLAPADAIFLARRLLRGADIAEQRELSIATVLAEQAAGIPYYLNVFVDRLAQRGQHAPTEIDVVVMVEELLRDPADPLDIKHYDRRIDEYYPHRAAIVRAMIDSYALAPAPLSIDEVERQLAAVDLDDRTGRDELLGLADRLEADHYLTRTGNADTIATPLLRRIWLALRRLE